MYDKIQSRCRQVKHAKRYKLRKANLRINKKIKNLVSDLHKKLVKWLLENHKVILLPEYKS